jgi:hypothetical protein
VTLPAAASFFAVAFQPPRQNPHMHTTGTPSRSDPVAAAERAITPIEHDGDG